LRFFRMRPQGGSLQRTANYDAHWRQIADSSRRIRLPGAFDA
jgi:hypothetical protein